MDIIVFMFQGGHLRPFYPPFLPTHLMLRFPLKHGLGSCLGCHLLPIMITLLNLSSTLGIIFQCVQKPSLLFQLIS